jgi:hypothetical protein
MSQVEQFGRLQSPADVPRTATAVGSVGANRGGCAFGHLLG